MLTELSLIEFSNMLADVNVTLIILTSGSGTASQFLRNTNALQKQLPVELFYNTPECKRKRKEWGITSSKRIYADYLKSTLNIAALRPIQNFEAAFGEHPSPPSNITAAQRNFYDARIKSIPPLCFNMELIVLRYDEIYYKIKIQFKQNFAITEFFFVCFITTNDNYFTVMILLKLHPVQPVIK